MKRLAWILHTCECIKWFVKISAIAAVLIILVSSCSGDVQSYTVKEKVINEAVYASGEIFPEHYFLLKGISTERVSQILVKEGDIVKERDILVYLGTAEDVRQVGIAQEQLTIAKSDAQVNAPALDAFRKNIELAKYRQEQDMKNANRYKLLSESKAVSAKEAEQYRMIAESSGTEYIGLQKQYETKKNALANILLDAEMVLAQRLQSYENKVLRSKISGKVYSIQKKEGEVVNSGETILLIGSENKYMLELLVDERDILKINIGQKVYFETDISKDQFFEGVISKIDPLVQKKTRSFKVEATIISSFPFFPLSTVEANIVIRENEKSILIPINYLLKGDSVLCQSIDAVLQPTKVSTGIRNDNFIEIRNGLNIGDVIYKSEPQ